MEKASRRRIEFPHELGLAIQGLNSNNRQKILLILQDQAKRSFSEISKETGIEKSLLSHQLNVLAKSLLVEHFYEHRVGDDKFSFYQISAFGRRILEALNEVLNPLPENKVIPLFKGFEIAPYPYTSSTTLSDFADKKHELIASSSSSEVTYSIMVIVTK